MDRRKFVAGSASAALRAAGALGWPLGARSGQRKVPVIGLLDRAWSMTELSRGLHENGFARSNGFRFEHSGWAGRGYQAQELADYAASLVRREVDLILAFSNQA